jgi:hypothetical protein
MMIGVSISLQKVLLTSKNRFYGAERPFVASYAHILVVKRDRKKEREREKGREGEREREKERERGRGRERKREREGERKEEKKNVFPPVRFTSLAFILWAMTRKVRFGRES